MSKFSESRIANVVRTIISRLGSWLKQTKIRFLTWCIARNAALQRWLIWQLQKAQTQPEIYWERERRSQTRYLERQRRRSARTTRRLTILDLDESDDKNT